MAEAAREEAKGTCGRGEAQAVEKVAALPPAAVHAVAAFFVVACCCGVLECRRRSHRALRRAAGENDGGIVR